MTLKAKRETKKEGKSEVIDLFTVETTSTGTPCLVL